jgi:anti-sigma factor RsiW
MCPDSEMVSLYYDAELPSPWKEKMEVHLRECAGCRTRLEQYRNLSCGLNGDSGTVDKALDAAKDRVWERLSTSRRHRLMPGPAKFRYRSVSVPLPVAIAAVAALIIGFGLLLARKAPVNTALQDGALAAGFESAGLGIEMQTIPASDMSGVIQYLGNDDSGDIVIIRLPESKSFMSLGEPAIVKAADYTRRRTP